MEYKVGGIDFLLNKAEKQLLNASWVLLNVRSGMGMCRCQGRFLCLDEGELLLLPPGADLAFDSAALGDEYNASLDVSALAFDESWLNGLLHLFPKCSSVVLALKGRRSPSRILGTKWLKICGLTDRLSTTQPQQEAMVILEILDLLAESSEIQTISDTTSVTEDVSEKKEKIDRFISCNLLGRFSLDEISAYVGMNRTYFCLFFKKHYGISLTDHVNRKRVDMACAMLKQGNMPIAEIAKASGFPTVTYFNRVFKKIMGISPRELQ